MNIRNYRISAPYHRFIVHGESNIEYTVMFNIDTGNRTCSCPNFFFAAETKDCKHIKYILTQYPDLNTTLDTCLNTSENKFKEKALEIANLVKEKNDAYGDSFINSAAFLQQMYPNGITKEQYLDAIFIARMYDKLHRIATNKNAFCEDPYKDIAGYALLRMEKQV